jgi:hypothetical protein
MNMRRMGASGSDAAMPLMIDDESMIVNLVKGLSVLRAPGWAKAARSGIAGAV